MKKRWWLPLITFIAVAAWSAMCPIKAGATEKGEQTQGLGVTGTEFWFSFPPGLDEEGTGGGIRVFAVSKTRQRIRLEIPGKNHRQEKICEAGGVAEFSLTSQLAQPFVKDAISQPPNESAIYNGVGIRLWAESPFSVYGLNRFPSSADGFMAIPVSALGRDYVVSSYGRYTAPETEFQLPSQTVITAAYDNTEVTFEMGGAPPSRTAGGLRSGQSRSWSLNRGDVVYVADGGTGQDISGSVVRASKPVAVVSGNQCANVPVGVTPCDYICEMELPSYMWGKRFHVAPIAGRTKNPVLRIYAREPGTIVLRDGQSWLTLGPNGRLPGVAEVRVTGDPAVKTISSNNPIYVVLYNPGADDDNALDDPFQMNLIPQEQYDNEVIFTTPGTVDGGLSFVNHFVNLIYQPDANGRIPDDLEFGTTTNGVTSWGRVSIRFGATPGTPLVDSSDGIWMFKRLAINTDGVYQLRAKNKFCAYLNGRASFVSYGYPTWSRLRDLTKTDTIPPVVTFTTRPDGSVLGSSELGGDAKVVDLPLDPAVRTNLSMIYMDNSPDSSFNYLFSFGQGAEFVAGLSDTTDWSLKVVDSTKDARAKLWFVDRSGNQASVTVAYRGFNVRPQGTAINLGSTKPGRVANGKVTLLNQDPKSATVTKILFNGDPGFALASSVVLPLTLGPNERRDIDFTYTPSTLGRRQTLISVTNDVITIQGPIATTQVSQPQIRANDIDLGVSVVGTTRIFQVSVVNPGTVPLDIIGVSPAPSNSPFRRINWPEISAQSPFVVEPGEVRSLAMEFVPTDSIRYQENLTFSGDSPDADSVAVIVGTGRSGAQSVGEDNQEAGLRILRVAPNPTFGNECTVEIESSTASPLLLELISAEGQVLAQAPFDQISVGSNQLAVSVANLASGRYLVRISNSLGAVSTMCTVAR